MTNRKTTRRALVLSLLSLLICCSMLVGTTFAWFTDSVTSGKNVIIAGNLDVELEYSKNMVDGTWASVKDKTDLVDPNALWEPGRTEVVYLRITNKGTLALKYSFAMSVVNAVVGESVEGNEIALADYLKYSLIEEPVAAFASRDDARAEAEKNAKALSAYSDAAYMEPGDTRTMALVVFMPEAVGNEANYRGDAIPTIELGVNVLATQKDFEEDSFGDDYDLSAPWTGAANTDWYDETASSFEIENAEELAGLAALVNAGNSFENASITLTGNIDLDGKAWTPIGTVDAPFAGTLDGNGHVIAGLTVKGAEYCALINYTTGDAVVENLSLVDVDIESAKHAAGVVLISNGDSVTLKNITVSGKITAASYAGGLVHNAANATVIDCENNATVSASRAAGIGSWLTSNATIEGCVNNGNITGSIGASGIAHGFAGSVTDCVNNGAITSTGTEPAAGIAGVQKGASTYSYCVNNGDVTSTCDNANASAAGILGQTPGSAATLTYCANYGKITAEQSYAGGIAYSLYGSINASYCYNAGNVAGADGAGAIAPKAQYGAADKATACLNAGEITSTNGVVYQGSNKNTDCFYYNGTQLTAVGGAAVEAETAIAVLNGGADNTFFAITDGVIAAK